MLRDTQTEKIGFVQVSTFNKGLWTNPFKSTIPAAYGYVIVVFRDRYYVGSISATGANSHNQIQQELKEISAKNGDTLIWIALTPRPVELNVPLTTKDPTYPVCKLTLMLKVEESRSVDFANLFNQNNDPIKIVEPLIFQIVQRYASQRLYNELDEEDMRSRVLQSLYGENKRYGLAVDSVSHISLMPDAHITEQIQIIKQADINELQERANQRLTDQKNAFEIEQTAIKNERSREEQDKDDARARRKDMHDGMHQIIKDGQTKQIQRNFNAGKSLYHIQEENPDIQNIYAPHSSKRSSSELGWQEKPLLSGSSGERRALDTRTTASIQANNDKEDIPGLSRQNLIAFSLKESGITVMRVQLSATQRQKAGTQSRNAMLVCRVDTTDSDFAVGDLITMIAGIAVTDIENLVYTLKEQPSTTLSAQILRGETMYTITINSMAE